MQIYPYLFRVYLSGNRKVRGFKRGFNGFKKNNKMQSIFQRGIRSCKIIKI
jgi:hypothetical protein